MNMFFPANFVSDIFKGFKFCRPDQIMLCIFHDQRFPSFPKRFEDILYDFSRRFRFSQLIIKNGINFLPIQLINYFKSSPVNPDTLLFKWYGSSMCQYSKYGVKYMLFRIIIKKMFYEK